MKKRMLGIAVVATVMLLTGCGGGESGGMPGGNGNGNGNGNNDGNGDRNGNSGNNGVADDRYVGLPEGHDFSTMLTDRAEPTAMWLVPGESFAVITWGSSSCAPVATAIEAQDVASVVVTFASPNSAGPCTADMAATTHEFSVPPDAAARPLEITIRFEGYDEEHVSTLE